MAKKIADLKVNENFELPALIKQMDVRVAKNGKRFLALVFSDTSGEIAGKLWDATAEDAKTFQGGKVVLLSGKCELYNNSLQAKIIHLKLTDEYAVTEFMQRAPLNVKQLQEQINDLVLEITQPHWNRVVRYLLNQNQENFFYFPAAKVNHHDYAGGLAFHTISIATLAKSVCKQYENVNRSLLIAGAILHDLGKTKELSGPIDTQYTLEGSLLGHIVLLDEDIISACEKLKIDAQAEDMVLLRHMIVSHHGLTEYGSPTRPQILEAEILHQLDQLDATINMVTKAVKNVPEGGFSERVFGLDNRRFYVPEQ